MHSPPQPLSLRRNTKGIVFGLPSRASAGLGAACKSLGAPCGGFVGRGSCSFFLLGGVLCVCCLCLCCCLRWLPCLPAVLCLLWLAVAGRACPSAWRVAFCCLVGRGGLAGFCVFVPSGWFALLFAVLCFAVAVGFACGLCGGGVAVARGASVAVVGGLRSSGRVAVGGVSLVLVAVACLPFSAVRWLLLLCPLAVAGGFFFVRAMPNTGAALSNETAEYGSEQTKTTDGDDESETKNEPETNKNNRSGKQTRSRKRPSGKKIAARFGDRKNAKKSQPRVIRPPPS